MLFGGEVLRGFSLALFVGSITGTYSTIAIASPIAIWWQDKLGAAKVKEAPVKESEKTGLGIAAFGHATTGHAIGFLVQLRPVKYLNPLEFKAFRLFDFFTEKSRKWKKSNYLFLTFIK